jgi:hypothetical protein
MTAPLHILNWILSPKLSMAWYSIHVLFWSAPTLGTFFPIFYFPLFLAISMYFLDFYGLSRFLIVAQLPDYFGTGGSFSSFRMLNEWNAGSHHLQRRTVFLKSTKNELYGSSVCIRVTRLGDCFLWVLLKKIEKSSQHC